MNNAMKELFSSFIRQSDILQDCLSRILADITEGKVPSADDVKILNNGLENLKQDYDNAYEAAKSAVLPEKLPEHGSSIADIITAVEVSENNDMSKQLSYDKSILKKFISIKSSVGEYTNAISSHQIEAQKILEQLNPDTINDLHPKIEAPALFLQLMDMSSSDIHNSNGIKLRKKLRKFYHGDEIQFGLISKEYYYDNSLPVKAAAEDRQTNKTEITDKNPEDNESAGKGISETGSQADKGEFKQRFENGINHETDVKSDVFLTINQDKIAKPHLLNFKKELSEMCMEYKEVASILSLFTHYGFMNDSQIFRFGIYLDCFRDNYKIADRVYLAVDLLANNGFLSRFVINDATYNNDKMTAYCLTSYCLNSMHTKEIESQLKSICGLNYGTVSLAADTAINAALASNFYYSNYALLDFLYAQMEFLETEEFQLIAKLTVWKQDHYQTFATFKDDFLSAYVVTQYTDIESIVDPYIILSLKYNKFPKHYNSACEYVFAVKNNQIYSCLPDHNILNQIAIYNAFSENFSEYEEEYDTSYVLNEDKEEYESDDDFDDEDDYELEDILRLFQWPKSKENEDDDDDNTNDDANDDTSNI